MSDINFLEETISDLKSNGKSPSDVLWIGNESGYMDWSEFESLADFEYDNGYGGEVINTSLKIVGKDWWMERWVYDGSEWWEFKTMPERPNDKGNVSLNSYFYLNGVR